MNRRLLIMLAGAVLILGGLGATIAAQQVTKQEEHIIGTIEVPLGARLTGLADLATVTPEEAITAAQEALVAQEIFEVTPMPSEVELEVENGFLVWEVEFPGWEVVVDAGSGEVLLIEDESEDDDALEDRSERGEDDTN